MLPGGTGHRWADPGRGRRGRVGRSRGSRAAAQPSLRRSRREMLNVLILLVGTEHAAWTSRSAPGGDRSLLRAEHERCNRSSSPPMRGSRQAGAASGFEGEPRSRPRAPRGAITSVGGPVHGSSGFRARATTSDCGGVRKHLDPLEKQTSPARLRRKPPPCRAPPSRTPPLPRQIWIA